MNNLVISIKRFFKNKNTVTIIGVIAILLILYFGYNTTIKNATNPVKIPVATTTIQPRTEIKPDMVTTIDVPAIAVKGSAVRTISAVLGKWTNVNSVIPEGSMFFSQMLVTKEELPDAAFTEVKKGEVVYNFHVNMESTYGNSIFPSNKIDIYMKAENESGQIMVGKLIENVEVLAVKDSQGRHVFENTSETRTPSFLIFGVVEEIHILLRKASYMRSYGVELFPVPHGGVVPAQGATQVSTQYLKDFINAHTVVITSDDDIDNVPDIDQDQQQIETPIEGEE
ncbi:MAG TPA: hypothetical protein GX747_03865 [Tenericutes bacterium]|nr:hypothetical protein [Mycoplasmatota bacterium]